MAKYTSDGNLIQGAATAYKNYDNAPGMYAGLDKVIEQGGKIFEEQMEKRRVVEKKFDDASEGVLMRSGALGKTLYGTATEDAKKFRKLYIEGVNTRDPNKKMEAMVALQNLSLFVQDHKQTNLEIAESRNKKELSSYYEDSAAGRRKAEIMTQIQDQKYSKVSENEEGQKQFHIKLENGEEVLVTNKEYKEMASTIRNYTTGNSYMGALDNAREQEIFSDDIFAQKLKPDLPQNNNEWDATAYDDVIAGNKNLPKMLNDSESLDQEIISALGQDAYQEFDTDGKSYYVDKGGNKIEGLSPDEKAAFIDAVVNSENPLFNLKTSNQILIDQLTNAGRNSHTTHWKKINDDKAIKEQKALDKDKGNGLNLSYGYRTWGQMKSQYDQINAGTGIIKGGDGTIWNKQENGTYKLKGGEEVRTPNQLKDHLELNHLDSFEEPEGGYVNNEGKGGGNGNNDIPELPTPNVEDFAYDADVKGVIANWENRYKGMGFTYVRDRTIKTRYVITADNGAVHVTHLGKKLGKGKKQQAEEFNKFIEENKQTTETLEGRTPEEIKESVAKGEESKFNVGPDGELLSEGYTMNDLGKVVWVGVGPEPTNT